MTLMGGARPTLLVDLDAVRDNAQLFADRIAGDLMAVVKADGFGHGAVDVARAALAGGASWLGVTTVDEALSLRRAGFRNRILSWLNTVHSGFDEALVAGIDLAVPGVEHLDAVCRAAVRTGRRARIHLHVDCGMARDGAELSRWRRLCVNARQAQTRGNVSMVGVMGHLGCADQPADPHNEAGRACFEWAAAVAVQCGLSPVVCHLAATAATLTDPRTHYDLSRVGAGLFGIDPSGSTRLRGTVTLSAPVVSIRDVPAGTTVGYGHSYVTPRPTRLALLPLGYADGIPRLASARASVLLRGQRRPTVGRVSMDQIVVDVGDEPVCPGETAIVFGPGDAGEPTLAEWADWAQTIEHDIVTGIGSRVSREVSGTRRRTCTRPSVQKSGALL